MNRTEILEAARQIVTQDRNREYGEPEQLFERIAQEWSAHARHEFSPVDVGLMMARMKLARIEANPGHADSWIDAIGYLACAAELAIND